MTATKLKWLKGYTVHGVQNLRSYTSACLRFTVVAIISGPWGTTWEARDVKTGEVFGDFGESLKACKEWCQSR